MVDTGNASYEEDHVGNITFGSFCLSGKMNTSLDIPLQRCQHWGITIMEDLIYFDNRRPGGGF